MTQTEEQGRVGELVSAVSDLREFARQLPSIEAEIDALAGVAARLGLRLLNRGPRAITINLRRHENIAIRETVTLLKHLAGLKRGGVTPPDMDGVRALVRSRKDALEAALLAAEEMDMIRIEPDLRLDLRSARIDGDRAVREFLGRTGAGDAPVADGPADRQDFGATLFADYVSSDLPEEEREATLSRIRASDILKRYTHDELIVISKLRQVIMKVDGYGYGVAPRRRPLFSKARRNVLWSAPRVGAIMVTHLPSWKRQAADIGHLLLDLRRYEQHMQDLAMVPEDDDWFTADDPLVRAVLRDAWQIHLRGVKIISEIQRGPSAHRFDDGFFDRFPGTSANYTPRFLDLAAPVINAMAIAGVCGRGERDLAMMDEDLAEANRSEQSQASLLGAFRKFFV